MLQFPIENGDVANDKQLATFVHGLAERYKAGRNIYIHCANGHGRTGVLALTICQTLTPACLQASWLLRSTVSSPAVRLRSR